MEIATPTGVGEVVEFSTKVDESCEIKLVSPIEKFMFLIRGGAFIPSSQ